MNMSLWFNLYSFDVMGQLAFGKEYGMVRAGKRHWALDLLSEGMKTAGFKIPVWLFRVIAAIPGLAAGMHKFLRFSQEEMQWRVDNLNAEGDITGWLLKAYKDIENPAKDPMLNADCRLIIVAGSDTTAACMTFLFYELAKKPEELKKLRDELKPLAKADWSDIDIRNAQHLNGAINESLRLHPPVPSGVDREVPEQGVTLKNGVYLPGQTIVQQPQYVISRSKYPQDTSVYLQRRADRRFRGGLLHESSRLRSRTMVLEAGHGQAQERLCTLLARLRELHRQEL